MSKILSPREIYSSFDLIRRRRTRSKSHQVTAARGVGYSKIPHVRSRDAWAFVVTCLIALISTQSFAAPPTSGAASGSAATRVQVASGYGNLPLSFEANAGQTDKRVRFISRGNGYSLFLTDSYAVLALTKSDGPNILGKKRSNCTDVVRMELAGADHRSLATGEQQLPGTANYFVGNDPANWRSGMPTYAKVRYEQVYPGVDLDYYGNQRQLEYDFVVAPGADPKPIRLRFAGAGKLALTDSGDLKVTARDGEIVFHKPVIYQRVNGRREAVAGSFRLLAHKAIGFTLGSYNRQQPLIIDPILAYSTFLGGESAAGDLAAGIAVDSSGNAYITGQAGSNNFPVTGGSYQQTNGGAASLEPNAFITKLNPTGTALVYSTYLGGAGATHANAIAIDSSGNAYVTGQTLATNFPTTTGAYATSSPGCTGCYTAFVTKLNAAGSALVYSTYLGGGGNGSGTGDIGNAIAVNSSGDAYVAGETFSSNFPTTAGAPQTVNNEAQNDIATGFVAELNPAGTALVYSTYLGGSGTGQFGKGDIAYGIALDSSKNAYITGSTGSIDFPTTSGAYLTSNPASANSANSAFVTKLNPTGTALAYSTYLGGSENAYGYAIALDASGNAYVTGAANFTDFPVISGAYQAGNNASGVSADNAFVTKLNSTGTALIYSTWLGGSGLQKSAFNKVGDSAGSIAVDSAGDAYVAGTAFSSNFPVSSGAFQPTNEGAAHKTSNAFVTELNPAGTALVYSTYIGGTGVQVGGSSNYAGDNAAGVALDSAGNIYVAGVAESDTFPISAGAYQISNNGVAYDSPNAFITKFSTSSLIATATTLTSSANPASAGTAVTFTAEVAPESGTTTPTGSVIFTVDGTAEPAATVNSSGDATFATSTLSVGAHTVSAVYSGDSTFSTSNSESLTETISSAFVVGSATTLTSSANPASQGALVTFTATVTPASGSATPTGTVTFTIDGTAGQAIALSSGKATFAISTLTSGTHTVTASYGGSDSFNPSISSNLTETINSSTLSETTTALVSSANPGTLGNSVTLTATVTKSSSHNLSGSVTFIIDGIAEPAITLSAGTAAYTTSSFSAGTHKVTASYGGSSRFAASSSSDLTETITAASTATLSSNANQPTAFMSVMFTAAVAAASGPTVPTGTVVFTIDGTAEPAVTLSNGFATYTTTSLNAGYHTIVAAYSGNVMFASSTSTISLTVGQATPTISWPALTPVSYGTALSATQLDATSPVAGTFAYTPSVGTVLNAGLQTLSVTFTPTDTTDYTSATATVTLTVNKVTPTITWPIPATIAYGTALSATQLDATSATAGTFTYTPAAGTLLKAGAQTLSVTFTPTDATDYASATATVTLTVNQEILYVTAYGQSKIYGAALPTLTYAFAGFVKGDTAATATTGVPSLTTTATVSSSVGTYPITVTAGTLTATNYSLKLKPGTLTVTQAPLYVTANAANKVYGAALPTLTYTYAGFLNGDTAATATTGVPSLSTTATVSSPVGTYPITVAAGTLTATNYSLKLKPGTLTVTPASLYVTAYNQSMMRGAPLPTLTYAFAGFVNGDKASTATSGVPSLSTTATSSSPAGTYPITVAVGTLTAANYNLVLKPGTLTITAP